MDYIFNKLEQDEGIFILHYDRIFSKSNSKENNVTSSEKLLNKSDDPEKSFNNGTDFVIESPQGITNDNINDVSNENSNL